MGRCYTSLRLVPNRMMMAGKRIVYSTRPAHPPTVRPGLFLWRPPGDRPGWPIFKSIHWERCCAERDPAPPALSRHPASAGCLEGATGRPALSPSAPPKGVPNDSYHRSPGDRPVSEKISAISCRLASHALPKIASQLRICPQAIETILLSSKPTLCLPAYPLSPCQRPSDFSRQRRPPGDVELRPR
jgi:hypothetical protein